ncbi:hypothetical protein F7R25_04030 [Burkholderia stagnalis]|uniref:Uncharacterized protein n=1 Tax=Burkholderia stagnalis TaxID=1503054 RepID=A0A6L3N311_9BURK|nr:hypothetical protein [Burkholderia stagnalis]KAB0640673.1 hypothetical protein F7R25_04030 [Burkholderia stagnalis]VWB06342.1 hypothetical protein BST28156_00115 [Burkholderia stagnalis]
MFSLSRAIEEFSIKRQEKVLSKKVETGRLNALQHVFGVPLEMLKGMFSNPMEDFNSDYPRTENLGSLGIEAFLVTVNVEINSFPLCLNLIKAGKKEISRNHYEQGGRHTLVAHDDEFGGRNIRLLTNDIELIKSLAKAKYGPPPPWVVWYDLGPYPYNQGNEEHWSVYVWSPYWVSLSLEEQDKFIEDWREKTKSYISDEDWDSWVFKIRFADPKSKFLYLKQSGMEDD